MYHVLSGRVLRDGSKSLLMFGLVELKDGLLPFPVNKWRCDWVCLGPTFLISRSVGAMRILNEGQHTRYRHLMVQPYRRPVS